MSLFALRWRARPTRAGAAWPGVFSASRSLARRLVLGRLGAESPRSGQALVELALVSMVLAIMFVGSMDIARVFYFDVTATSAAQEAVRAAAMGRPDADVIAQAIASAPSGLISSSDVTVSPAQGTRATLTAPVWATVNVQFTFSPFTPLAKYIFGNTVTVTRSASQRVRTPCAQSSGDACS